MIRYFIGIVAVLLTVALLARYVTKADPKKLARQLRAAGGIALLAAALLLTLRGLFVYAVPLAWIGYSLLRGRTPFPSSFPGSARKSSGQQSRVRTGYLEMRLDHDSGDMEGLVLKGEFEGKFLSDLSLDELLQLLVRCDKDDAQSAQLLIAYLDRTHPEWRERDEASESRRGDGAPPSSGGAMSVEEAYDILGLSPGASESEIRKAHRRLMKKLHPDQEGGSTWLASRVNEAKDLLLGK
ncbi:MAG: DnaJ domain-containing protein [Methyloligellaceae bacterium]